MASASICSIACSHAIPYIPIPVPPWASRHVTHHLQHRSLQVSCRSVGAGSEKKQAGYEERLEIFYFTNPIDFNSYILQSTYVQQNQKYVLVRIITYVPGTIFYQMMNILLFSLFKTGPRACFSFFRVFIFISNVQSDRLQI